MFCGYIFVYGLGTKIQNWVAFKKGDVGEFYLDKDTGKLWLTKNSVLVCELLHDDLYHLDLYLSLTLYKGVSIKLDNKMALELKEPEIETIDCLNKKLQKQNDLLKKNLASALDEN